MNLQEFNTKVKSLKIRGARFAHEFNQLVMASVHLYWTESNHNIKVVNDCLEIAGVTKGIRVSGLKIFYQHCIPHHWDQKAGYFAEKIKDSVLTYEGAKNFLVKCPHWTEASKDQSESTFDLFNYVGTVITRLKNNRDKYGIEQLQKAKETIDKFLEEELMFLAAKVESADITEEPSTEATLPDDAEETELPQVVNG